MPPIVALVDATGAGPQEIEKSLRSLSAERIVALPIGTAEIPTLADAVLRIDWMANPWLMPIVAGDTLASGTGGAYRGMIGEVGARIVYADDDLLDRFDRRLSPHFKPDWNSEMFRHFDYLTGACIFQVARDEIGALVEASDWASQLVARLAEGGAPRHVHRILHHRHSRPEPRVPASAARSIKDLPSVSIIIPTRNRVDLLRTCLNGIAATDYPEVDVIIVDNDSDDPETLDFLTSLDPASHRVLRHAGAFNFSAINNHAVQEARGQMLCLLNNDIEVIEPGWLASLAVQAMRPDVGAVGARLLYPDYRLQHAGVVIGVGGAAAHAHRLLGCEEEGYFHRHRLPQFITAVTAACMVVERSKFLAVGGLDECNFPVAFNDVDLCLRLNNRGWQSFYEPRATLIHHESVSRGLDRDPVGAARLARELAALKRIWKTDQLVDPFHHPQLSRESERFVIAL